MIELFVVCVGGSIGALLRYLLSKYALDFGLSYQMTLCINILGCCFLSFVSYLSLKRSHIVSSKLKLFLNTGIAGGFTTFSTFSYEAFKMFSENQYLLGLLYIGCSCIMCLFAAFWGAVLAQRILKYRLVLKRKKNRMGGLI